MNKTIKKTAALLMAIVISLSCIPVLSFAENEGKTVYISASGSDTTGDGTLNNPYATIAKAVNVVEDSAATSGKIIVCGNLTTGNITLTHAKPITISGETKDVTLTLNYWLKGPTTFENITLGGSSNYINTSNYNLTFGKNVKSAKALTLNVRSNSTIMNSMEAANQWVSVMVRLGQQGETINNDINFTVNGGCLRQIYIDGSSSLGKTTVNGNVNVILNNSTWQVGAEGFGYTSQVPTINGAYQLILNNGLTFKKDASFDGISPRDGLWILKCADRVQLSTTETVGRFKLEGEGSVKAVNAQGTEFFSDDSGFLNLVGKPDEYKITSCEDVCKVVYVSSTGSDTEGDGTINNPYATISKAESIVESSASTMGSIIIRDNLIADKSSEAHTKPITISGESSDVILTLNYLLKGPTTFENITLGGTTNYINSSNHDLVFGEGVKSAKALYINLKNNSTIMNSMDVANIYVSVIMRFGQPGQTVNNDINYTVNGGCIRQIYFDGNSSAGKTTVNGNVNVTLNNMTWQSGAEGFGYLSQAPAINGAYQVILNNGIAFKKDTSFNSIKPRDGLWIMKGASGVKLSTTETVGRFKVKNDSLVIATNAQGTEFASENGYLVVPEGEYSVSTYSPHIEELIYYVSENGSDNSGDGTEAKPYASLEKAEEMILAVENVDKRVIKVRGTVEFSATAHDEMIYIEGYGKDGTKIKIVHKSLPNNINYGGTSIQGPTSFDNLTLYNETNDDRLVTHGKQFIIGNNVNVDYATTFQRYKLVISAGDRINDKHNTNFPGARENVTVGSAISNVSVGSYYNERGLIGYTAGADITFNRGWNRVVLGGDIFKKDGKYTRATCFTENVNVVVNGGNLYEVTYEKREMPTFEKGVQIINNGGKIELIDLPENIGGGLWILDCVNDQNCSIEPTTTSGTFNVLGGKTAVAASEEEDRVVVSDKGVLTLPEGKYKVTFVDEVEYLNSGVTITVQKGCYIDFNDVYHREIENNIFLGWYNQNDEAVSNGTFEKDTVLTAKYFEYNSKSFEIVDTQLNDGTKKGLRFVVSKNIDLSKILNISDYGTIILPTVILNDNEETLAVQYNSTSRNIPLYYRDLIDGKNYKYKGKSYTPIKIQAENLYKVDGVNNYYTVCVANIPDASREYTVRGYISYVDANGVIKNIYTDYKTCSALSVAKQIYKDVNYKSGNNVYCDAIIATYSAKMNEITNQPKVTVFGTENSEDWEYTLGKLVVRECNLSGINADKTPVIITQPTDFHFNIINEQDVADANPTLLSTWYNRKWNRNGYPSSVNSALSMEYADWISDQMVITGDVMDHLSKGSANMLKKMVFDRYPNSIVTTGNHEWVQYFEGQYPDFLSQNYKAKFLENVWKPQNDMYYHSKVIKDKVMVIQLENGLCKFWPQQVEPLRRDIAIARENNYTVLIFAHIPLNTENDAYAETKPLAHSLEDSIAKNLIINLKNDTKKNVGGNSSKDSTREVYDLIVNNADVIKGVFVGHLHDDYYSEIKAKNHDGTDAVIPQYIVTASAYDGGALMKIIVK